MTTHELDAPAVDDRTVARVEGVDADSAIGTIGARYATELLVQETTLYRVYSAHDTHLDRPVHLLVLRDDRSDRLSSVGLFAATVAATADLDHSILASVFDAGVDERADRVLRWAAREPVLDPPLTGLRAAAELSASVWTQWALSVATNLADGLQAVHAHGLVHGDLGPHTVHLSAPGFTPVRVKVDGFGPQPADIADLSDPERTVAMWREFTASLGNPAPEQLAGRAPSRRTDIHGYGIVLQALLLEAEEHAARPDDEPSLALGVTDPILRGLHALAGQATSEAPNARPYSFAVVQDELRRITQGSGAILAQPVEAVTGVLQPVVEATPTAVLPPLTTLQPQRALEGPGTDTVRNALMRPVAPRRGGGGRVVIAVVAIIAVVLAIGALLWFTVARETAASAGDVTVPAVVGVSVEQANTTLADAGLSPSGVREQFDPTIAAGLVVGTEPAAGTSASHGAAVTVLVSSGADLVAVPQLQGMTLTAAQEALAAAGLTAGDISRRDGPSAADTVLGAEPGFGTQSPRGSAVRLIVASGRIGIPTSILGQTAPAAIAQLQALGLQVQTRSEVTDAVGPGLIAGSDPSPGSSVNLGGIVTLLVAEAPPVSAPDPTPSAEPSQTTSPRPTPRPSSPSPAPTSAPTDAPDEGDADGE